MARNLERHRFLARGKQNHTKEWRSVGRKQVIFHWENHICCGEHSSDIVVLGEARNFGFCGLFFQSGLDLFGQMWSATKFPALSMPCSPPPHPPTHPLLCIILHHKSPRHLCCRKTQLRKGSGEGLETWSCTTSACKTQKSLCLQTLVVHRRFCVCKACDQLPSLNPSVTDCSRTENMLRKGCTGGTTFCGESSSAIVVGAGGEGQCRPHFIITSP